MKIEDPKSRLKTLREYKSIVEKIFINVESYLINEKLTDSQEVEFI